jgi:alkylhydroperoxidase/carboxymuconolactone decarboxylase family protein YurZ
MEERTELLVCLGAATAANCVPCFEHYYKKAQDLGLASEQVQVAVDLANKVKKGAHITMRDSISDIMKRDGQNDQHCGPRSNASCCG